MIRKCTDEDISDEELEKVINPLYDNYHGKASLNLVILKLKIANV